MVDTVGPLFVYTEGSASYWLKYTVNDDATEVRVWTCPYPLEAEIRWQEKIDAHDLSLFAYDPKQEQFNTYKILDNQLWRVTSRVMQGSVVPVKYEQAKRVENELVFTPNQSRRADFNKMIFEKTPLLSEDEKAAIVLAATTLESSSVVAHPERNLLSDVLQEEPVEAAETEEEALEGVTELVADEVLTLSLEASFEKILPIAVTYVQDENNVLDEHGVLYFWKYADTWHYRINLQGVVLSGDFDLDKHPILATAHEDNTWLLEDDASKSLIASIYLKLSPEQQELLKDMLSPTWPFLLNRTKEEQVKLARVILSGGNQDALSDEAQSACAQYRANLSLNYLQTQLEPDFFYQSQQMFLDAQKAKVSDIVALAQYLILAALREFKYLDTVQIPIPPQLLRQTLKSPCVEDNEVALLDEHDVVLDTSNDELLALALARQNENEHEDIAIVEAERHQAFQEDELEAQPHARAIPAAQVPPVPPRDLLLERFGRYYDGRQADRRDYLTTTSLFGFFRQGWGVSRADKMAAARWVIEVKMGRADYSEDAYQHHFRALHQGRLGRLFSELVERDGENWHPAPDRARRP